MGAGDSSTRTFLPRANAAKGGSVVDFDGFRRAVVELGLIDSVMLEVLAVRAAGDVKSLASLLVRAGKLTAYQAGALAQGKAKGLVIGPCLVLEKRGQGGMGVVFRAKHRESGGVVALKILLPSFGRDRDAVSRFRREFEVAARLDHPNVVRAMEADEDRGVQFLTMEYVEGHDLDDLVRSVGPLPIKQALHCVIQAARGLAAAHEAGIIHRDVKPGNLMLDAAGLVRVLDLGLARVIESTNTLALVAGASLTQSGAYMGTVDYMAPEQADDPKKANHLADIYSLGCTLHFLLAGRPPFGGKTILQRMMAHQNEPAPSLHDVRDDVTDLLEHIYLEMMAKRPGDRPSSMAEVVARLEACRSSAGEAREARDALMSFAETVMKRAAPRKRGRNPDASVFDRRVNPGGLEFDPDLDLEDLVMDYRDEAKVASLTEEQLPPMLPRSVAPRVKRRRGPAPGWLGLLALPAVCALGYLMLPRSNREPEPGPASPPVSVEKSKPGPIPIVSPGFQALFNGKDLTGWKPIDDGGADRWWVDDRILAVEGREKPFRGLITDRVFQEFRLRVEFQASSGADGGVFFVHDQEPPKDHFCREVNIGEGADGKLQTGIITKFNGAAKSTIRKPRSAQSGASDGWDTMEIVVKDNRETVTLNGRKIEYDGETDNVSGRHRIGLQDYKGTIRFRRVEIQELGDETPTSPTRPIRPKTPGVLFVDDFETPRSYWTATTPEQLAKEPAHRWGHREGLYFDEFQKIGWHRVQLPDGPYSDFSCEVVGRITGDKPTSKGSFIIHVVNGNRGVQVLIDGTGALFVEPWGLGNYELNTPWIGPYRNTAAIHPGAGAFNVVRLLVRKRKLEVFVNSVRVVNPLIFDWDLTPAEIQLGFACRTPMVRAEFDKVEIRTLGEETSEAADSKDMMTKPVRVPSDGGLVMPDGSQVFEGSQLKVNHVTRGNPRTQENMDDYSIVGWTNHRQLLWDGNRQGDVLALAVPVEAKGQYEIRALLTTANDYARVKLEIDGKPLGKEPFRDMYSPQVRNTGAVVLGFVSLDKGTSLFKVTIVGRGPRSGGFGFGLDELQLIPVR